MNPLYESKINKFAFLVIVIAVFVDSLIFRVSGLVNEGSSEVNLLIFIVLVMMYRILAVLRSK